MVITYRMSSPIFLTTNSSNIDLIDYFLNSISYVLPSDGIVYRKLALTSMNDTELCYGSVTVGNTIYTKQESQCFSCAIVNVSVDPVLISYLEYLIPKALATSATTVFINGTSYNCNTLITISGKPYYILNIV
jgi:hypothetical protein